MLGNDNGSDEDPTCELTTGNVICGNLTKALRSRRQKVADAQTTKRAEEILLQVKKSILFYIQNKVTPIIVMY